MPIKGKGSTDRKDLIQKASIALETIGTITKGAPRTDEDLQRKRPGQDLDYFLFRLKAKYDTEPMRKAIFDLFGEKPAVLSPVYAVGRNYEEAFPTHKEWWAKSGLVVRCDGEAINLHWDQVEGCMSEKPLPCAAPQCECKRIGRLFVVLPSLSDATGIYGQFMLTTHSIRDTERLSAAMLWAENLGMPLYKVPFVLERVPEEISVPLKDKETGQFDRRKVTKFFVRLRVMDGFVSQIGASSFAGALPATVSGGVTVPSSNGHEETAVGWANEQSINALMYRAVNGLGLNQSDVEGFTEFSVTDYAQWNRRFKDRASAAQFLKTCMDEAIGDATGSVQTPVEESEIVEGEIIEDQQESPEIDREAMERDIQAVREALIATGLQSSAIDTIAPQGDHFGVAITMGVTPTDLKGIKKSNRLELVDSSDEYVWVRLKRE